MFKSFLLLWPFCFLFPFLEVVAATIPTYCHTGHFLSKSLLTSHTRSRLTEALRAQLLFGLTRLRSVQRYEASWQMFSLLSLCRQHDNRDSNLKWIATLSLSDFVLLVKNPLTIPRYVTFGTETMNEAVPDHCEPQQLQKCCSPWLFHVCNIQHRDDERSSTRPLWTSTTAEMLQPLTIPRYVTFGTETMNLYNCRNAAALLP
jgi:hypothetical protein